METLETWEDLLKDSANIDDLFNKKEIINKKEEPVPIPIKKKKRVSYKKKRNKDKKEPKIFKELTKKEILETQIENDMKLMEDWFI